MTYFEDLASCNAYFGSADQIRETFGDGYRSLVAVGWLENGRSFRRAAPDERLLRALKKWLALQAPPMAWLGFHVCDLGCESNACGSRELFVPHERPGALYVMPELALHYMKVHGYRPPDEFIRSLLATADENIPFRAEPAGPAPSGPAALLSLGHANRYRIVPVRKEGGVLHVVGLFDLSDSDKEDLSSLLGCEVRVEEVSAEEFTEAYSRCYG